MTDDNAERAEVGRWCELHAGLRGGATGCWTPAFAAQVLHKVTPRMLQMMQMNVPQSAQG
jgi:hypothetical protein